MTRPLQRQIDAKVNISDKATEDDIADGAEDKWVSAALVGGTWKIGDIKYSYANQPSNWIKCDGSAVDKELYSELYSMLEQNAGYDRTLDQVYTYSNGAVVPLHNAMCMLINTSSLTLSLYDVLQKTVTKTLNINAASYQHAFKKNDSWYHVFTRKQSTSSSNGRIYISIVDEDLNLVYYGTYETGNTYSESVYCAVNEYGDIGIWYKSSSSGSNMVYGANAVSFGSTSGAALTLTALSGGQKNLYSISICNRILVVSMTNSTRTYLLDFTSKASTYVETQLETNTYSNKFFTHDNKYFSVRYSSVVVYTISSSGVSNTINITLSGGTEGTTQYYYDDEFLYVFSSSSTMSYINKINLSTLTNTVSNFEKMFILNPTIATYNRSYYCDSGVILTAASGSSVAIYSNISNPLLPESTTPPSYIKAK